MKSHLSTNYLLKVKKSLPVNGMEKVSEILGFSLSKVSRVLNGLTKKDQQIIVETCLTVVECEKEKIEDISNRIDAL